MAALYKTVRLTPQEISLITDALRYDRIENGDDDRKTKENLEEELIIVSEVNL